MLVDTLEAGYASGGYRPTRALYMHANTPERAKAVLAKLRKTHRRTEGLETLGEGAFEAEGDFFGRIIFFRAGAFIGGMISVPKGEPGVSFAEQFRNILRDAYADSLTPDERKDFLRSERR
jgi:hypothetical protein